MLNLKTGSHFRDLTQKEKTLTRRECVKGGLAAIIGAGVAPSIALGGTRIVSRTPLLAGAANGGVGRCMMRGIRTRNASMFRGGKPTSKDYVQDGLVGMWDGIDNAGYGSHDDDATVWKDLVSTNDFVLNDGSELPRWNSVSFHSDNGINCGMHANNAASNSLANAIELCVDVENSWTIDNRNDKQGDYFYSVGRTIYSSWWGYNSYGGSPLQFDSAGTYGLMDDYKTTNKQQNLYWIRNGELVGPFRYNNQVTGVCMVYGTRVLWIGGRHVWNTSLNFKGTIFAIRVYSRNLTAEEAAMNYSIDKIRFGI